jgi:hypothetical protein
VTETPLKTPKTLAIQPPHVEVGLGWQIGLAGTDAAFGEKAEYTHFGIESSAAVAAQAGTEGGKSTCFARNSQPVVLQS